MSIAKPHHLLDQVHHEKDREYIQLIQNIIERHRKVRRNAQCKTIENKANSDSQNELETS